MATINDLYEFQEILAEVRETPSKCTWFGDIKITYVPDMDYWIATIGCDFEVMFDYVDYSSNSIILMRRGILVGRFTHMHQRVRV